MPAKIDGRTKTAVLKFIEAFDAKNGRGGISAASRKYKVTRVTISRWLSKKPAVKSKVKPAKIVKTRTYTKKRKYTKRAPKAVKVVRRRGRRPSSAPKMKAFAKGLIAVAALQAKIAVAMQKLASVVG